MGIRKVSLIAGFLLGILPTVTESASFLEGNGKDGVAEKTAIHSMKTDSSVGQVAAKIAGDANMKARYLAAEPFQIKPRLVRDEPTPAAYILFKPESQLLKIDSGAGREAENFWIERLLVSIEEASQKIMAFHAANAIEPQKRVGEVQTEKIRVAVHNKPEPIGKARIESEKVKVGESLNLDPNELLEGGAVLFYERNWEFAASIARKPVFEASDDLYDLESVIISIFWRFRF